MTPRFIGRYEVIRELGSGYFGLVYLAEGEVPGKGQSGRRRRQVAIKMLKDPGDPAAWETLLQEFELLELVKHRTICKVYELLESDAAVVIEYVQGVTLRQVLDALSARGERMQTEAAIEVGCELADCLYQAWATPGPRGEPLHLVHRDLKPENVMLTAQGEVKVLDFGLARIGAGRPDDTLQGTPLYMAPEQALGHDVDHRTDLFAVGLMLFEVLMDRPAYQVPETGADPVAEVMRRIEHAELHGEIRSLETLLPGVGPVVARCLQGEPRARYQNGHELMLDLRRHLSRGRGAYLTDFCDYLFHHVFEGEAAAPEGPTGPRAGRAAPSRTPTKEPRRSEPMSNNSKPPRPDTGPPRPGGPPRPAAGPPRPAGPPGPPSGPPRPGGPVSGPPGRPPGPPSISPPGGDDTPKAVLKSSAKTGDETGMLQMVPLDEEGDDNEGKAKSATQFFAIPSTKKKPPKKPDAPPAAGGRALPGGAGGPPPVVGGPVAGGPMGGPPSISGPVGMGAPMAISGPVASGPSAGPAVGSRGTSASPFDVGGAPNASLDGADDNRARSYRVYAIVLGLFAMTFLAIIAAVGLVLFAMTREQSDTTSPEPAAIEKPAPSKPKPVIDTGTAPPPTPSSAPKPKPKPKPSGTTSPSPSPAPSPKPAASGSADVTIKIPDGVRYTGVEVTCPSGFRQRGAFSGTSAVVKSVPTGESCEANFKGGSPSVARGLSGGHTYNCTFPGPVASCK